jgi:hypothetical protein
MAYGEELNWLFYIWSLFNWQSREWFFNRKLQLAKNISWSERNCKKSNFKVLFFKLELHLFAVNKNSLQKKRSEQNESEIRMEKELNMIFLKAKHSKKSWSTKIFDRELEVWKTSQNIQKLSQYVNYIIARVISYKVIKLIFNLQSQESLEKQIKFN